MIEIPIWLIIVTSTIVSALSFFLGVFVGVFYIIASATKTKKN